MSLHLVDEFPVALPRVHSVQFPAPGVSQFPPEHCLPVIGAAPEQKYCVQHVMLSGWHVLLLVASLQHPRTPPNHTLHVVAHVKLFPTQLHSSVPMQSVNNPNVQPVLCKATSETISSLDSERSSRCGAAVLKRAGAFPARTNATPSWAARSARQRSATVLMMTSLRKGKRDIPTFTMPGSRHSGARKLRVKSSDQ
jgi:hypothetical protein